MPKNNPSHVVITAGPTRAYLDEVRFLSNYSSGALGYEVARVLAGRGIPLTVIHGPTLQPFSKLNCVKTIAIETIQQMQAALFSECKKNQTRCVVFAAAVLDFAPVKARQGKVSSKNTEWVIRLRPTLKLIDEVHRRYPHLSRVGFKLEARQGKGNPFEKAEKFRADRDLDVLCLNYLDQISDKKHPMWIVNRQGERFASRSKRRSGTLIGKQVSQLL